MRTLMQYLALAITLMVMFFGTNRMRQPEQTEQIRPTGEQLREERESTAAEQVRDTVPGTGENAGGVQDVFSAAQVDGEHVFLYDTGEETMVYCSTAQTDKLYPASITKLFSAWVALRILSPDTVVTAGWELGLLKPGSSSASIALDSQLTVEMLIEGMLLPSGNDAALVLAAAAGKQLLGSKKIAAATAVAEFVEEMNQAAVALGFQNSHFENPDGYHSEDHYSCPADLAMIARLALEDPVLRRCMGLTKDTVTFVSGEKHTWSNTNRLLNPESECYDPRAVGMKTGYTGTAGYCLLAAFGEENPVVVGIFGGTDAVSRYESAAQLYDLWKKR